MGSEFLSYRGERLGFLEYYADEDQRGYWPIEIEMSEHRALASEGSSVWGFEISRDVLTIKQKATGEVLAQESAICRREWALVP